MSQCDYQDCSNGVSVIRETLSGHALYYCDGHDPLTDPAVKDCFKTPEVGR